MKSVPMHRCEMCLAFKTGSRLCQQTFDQDGPRALRNDVVYIQLVDHYLCRWSLSTILR